MTTDKDMWFELQSEPTIKGKVEIVLKYYLECSKSDIERELKPFGISRENITHAIRDLKRTKPHPKVISKSRNWYRYVVSRGVTTDKYQKRENIARWFSDVVYFHGIRGSINGVDWSKANWDFPRDQVRSSVIEPVETIPNSFVRLVRNHSSLQFYFKYKREGFKEVEIIEPIAKLYQMLSERGIFGRIEVTYFEARNSRKVLIPELVGQTFQLPVLSNYILKAYQDKTHLETEIIEHGIPRSFAELTNAATQTKGYMENYEISELWSRKLVKANNVLTLVNKSAAANHYQASMQLGLIQDRVEKSSQKTEEILSYLDARLIELNQRFGMLESDSLASDLNEGFSLLTQRIQAITNDYLETKNQDLDSRYNIVSELQDLNEKIALLPVTTDRKQPVTTDRFNEKINSGAYNKIIQEILEITKSRTTKTKIFKQLKTRIRKQTVFWIINHLVETQQLQEFRSDQRQAHYYEVSK